MADPLCTSNEWQMTNLRVTVKTYSALYIQCISLTCNTLLVTQWSVLTFGCFLTFFKILKQLFLKTNQFNRKWNWVTFLTDQTTVKTTMPLKTNLSKNKPKPKHPSVYTWNILHSGNYYSNCSVEPGHKCKSRFIICKPVNRVRLYLKPTNENATDSCKFKYILN